MLILVAVAAAAAAAATTAENMLSGFNIAGTPHRRTVADTHDS